MEFLLDTNICIYIIKQKPILVFEKFQSLEPGSVGISTITLSELQYGVMKSQNPIKNQLALDHFLIPIEIVNYDFAASVEFGVIRNYLEKLGSPIGPLDTLIAAHAKSLDLTLVTNNEKEFQRVLNLKIQNWTIKI